MGRKSINEGGVEASRSGVEVGNRMIVWSESGRNYIWSEINDNFCDCGSVLVCVVRGVERRNVEGKTIYGCGKSCEAK